MILFNHIRYERIGRYEKAYRFDIGRSYGVSAVLLLRPDGIC